MPSTSDCTAPTCESDTMCCSGAIAASERSAASDTWSGHAPDTSDFQIVLNATCGNASSGLRCLRSTDGAVDETDEDDEEEEEEADDEDEDGAPRVDELIDSKLLPFAVDAIAAAAAAAVAAFAARVSACFDE